MTSSSTIKELSDSQKPHIYYKLLSKSAKEILLRKVISEVAELLRVHRSIVLRIWKRANDSLSSGARVATVGSNRKGSVGRKKRNEKEN